MQYQLTQKKIKALLKSGDWMIRFDNEGLSYQDFKWAPLGKWTVAPDFNSQPECGGGLHGQSPMAAGDCIPGSRMVLAETYGRKIKISNKIKVQKARIVAINDAIPLEFFKKLAKYGGSLNLSKYLGKLPNGLTNIGGDVDLRGYEHPLPNGLRIRKSQIIK